jgi:hypothetical protein
MSVVSNIVSQRLQPTSDLPGGVLMRWNHEPIALYQRGRQGFFYYIWPFLPCGVLTILFFCHFTLGMNKAFPFWILPIITLIAGVVITCFRLLPSDQWIELTEQGIHQRLHQPGGGGYFFSWAYKDIERCDIHCDSHKNVKFSVLKFSMKNERKRNMIIVPEEIDLDSVIKILRDNGVQISGKL